MEMVGFSEKIGLIWFHMDYATAFLMYISIVVYMDIDNNIALCPPKS